MKNPNRNTDALTYRKSYGKIGDVMPLPNLIEVQRNSYRTFVDPDNVSTEDGLGRVFSSVFPVNDFTGLSTMEFVSYKLEKPKYSQAECLKRGATYSVPIKVTLRLIVWVIDEDTGSKEVKSIKEQEVYFGDLPLMTPRATFIINGTERVVVSQLHRSPGVFFDHDKGKATNQTKLLYSARIIPYRGSWLDFEFDTKDLLYFRIDRRRKILATTFVRALGYTTEQILKEFYSADLYKVSDGSFVVDVDLSSLKGTVLKHDIVSADDNKTYLKAGEKITALSLKKFKSHNITSIKLTAENLVGSILVKALEVNDEVVEAGSLVTDEMIPALLKKGEFELISINKVNSPYIHSTMSAEKNKTEDDALIDIYKVLRPGDPPSVEASREIFTSLFFKDDKYDLSNVGRAKINERLDIDVSEDLTLLTKKDVIETVKTLLEMKFKNSDSDDIDHLGNRRVRSVGELVENQFRIGLVRVQRAIQERMNSVEIDTVLPQELINAKPLISTIREFYGTSQLSQFMDQTNPLSEITHKRRLSALGPGGLSRDRAGFEVRDVHTSHYGRICPIETPEGPNIGLINSIATYAKVNKFGFLESPYRKVLDGKVTNEVVYLSATQESKYIIAQANEELDEAGSFVGELHNCRHNGNYLMTPSNKVDLIDLSPKQVVSVAASLIPFLENDDANRALMGSNMQRQAVPLLYPQAPIVGTGMERVVAADSSACLTAKHDGVVEKVNASKIFIRIDDESSNELVEIYELRKYQRSNQDTCINQKPLVRVGQYVKKGDVIADGPSTKNGELALGRNVLVGFMSWNGYNFEDSIIMSEKIVSDDVFTSVHIEEYEITARDTRLGSEEVTRDIPNVGEEALRNLDEVGIVNIGAEVLGGDVIVGKVTPKSESPSTPEEKLLRAIFGEKAADVKDSSLYIPPGVSGTVIDVRVFTRRGVEKDQRTLTIERQRISKLTNDKQEKLRIIEKHLVDKVKSLVLGKIAVKTVGSIKSGSKLDEKDFANISIFNLKKITLDDSAINDKLEALIKRFDVTADNFERSLADDIDKLQGGDDLPQGVLKTVKVFVAVKRKLQPGDKMAGRHGNKGVISKIVPIEDMPYLEDGTPLDILLNPLGVPSRMNVGQILETHLGFASYALGKKVSKAVSEAQDKAEYEKLRKEAIDAYDDVKAEEYINSLNDEEFKGFAKGLETGLPIATPVFDGAKESDIVEAFEKAGLDSSGQMFVYDGKSGERFDRKVTVGYIYMIKLHHLVDDKIHARSIGPYSLVTQQPLGGKSHFGGQRFGEMECWALQAYGASFTLQEMLTVKSDDVSGRIKLYESVVRGDSNFEHGVPESFNVMIKELKSLCLNIDLEQEE
ncbi:MAG: DNA-directed RNA polymerase subunit beta [Alphaproteobacteria bacterium]|nr:DNA-directed RNA polymerase subunit beta [Alphaproteobacteria bacterium]